MKNKLVFILSFLLLSLVGATINLVASTPKIIGPDLIQKAQHEVLTLSDIINLYYCELGGISVEQDGYTGNGSTIGIYDIILVASDGNQMVSKEVELEVVSAVGYGVRAITNRKDIHIEKKNKLNPLDFVTIHQIIGLYKLNSSSQMELMIDNYSESWDQAGSYLYEYRVMDSTGFDKVVSFYINVYDTERINNPNIIPIEQEDDEVGKKISNALKIGLIVITVSAVIIVGLKFWKKRGL